MLKPGATFVWRGRNCGTALGLVVQEPGPLCYAPEVTKVVAGDDLQVEDFTLAIKETYDNQSWQGSDEALSDRDGKVTFVEQEYAETGNFWTHGTKTSSTAISIAIRSASLRGEVPSSHQSSIYYVAPSGGIRTPNQRILELRAWQPNVFANLI